MSNSAYSESVKRIRLAPTDNQRLAALCGQFDQNLQIIERHLGVEINNRGSEFEIFGSPMSVSKASKVILQLYEETSKSDNIDPSKVQLTLKSSDIDYQEDDGDLPQKLVEASIKLEENIVKPRTRNQRYYLNAIQKYDINFGIGPSGTGKTFLAVACALNALEKEKVGRIVLVRPAVEAGESLGFLPGDLSQKIDPYLRPLYDAFY